MNRNCGRTRRGPLGRLGLAVALVLMAGLTRATWVGAQTAETPIKRVLVTFDRSSSMAKFPHSHLNDLAAKILFDGISSASIDTTDKWAVRAGLDESFFSAPLLKPGCQLEVYKFADTIESVNLPSVTRRAFVAAGLAKRDCNYDTDIAGMAELVCRGSEKNWGDGGRTLWVFVSDDRPVSSHQTGNQAQRLRALELIYEWDPLLMIAVGKRSDPALVEVREVQNRLYKRYGELTADIPDANTAELLEITRKLEDLKNDVQRILQEKGLPKDLATNIEERIKALTQRAEREVYALKLGLFELTQPGTTDEAGRFVEGEPIRFAWTSPKCEGISHFTLQIRSANGTLREERAATNGLSLTDLTSNVYEWNVEAHGRQGGQDIAAVCSTTRTEKKWRSFRVAKKLGPFQLTPLPSTGVLVGSVTLTWTPSANAQAYVVVITPPDGPPIRSQRNVCELTESLPLGEYTWQVEAIGAGGFPVLASNPYKFKVVPPPPVPPGPPMLLVPKAGLSQLAATIEFYWTPVQNAKRYAFELTRPGGAVERKDELASPSCSVACTEPGSYRWRAGSIGTEKEPRWADEPARLFTIVPPPPVPVPPPLPPSPPVLTGPRAGALLFSDGVTFSWQPAERADGYELIVKTGNGAAVATVRVAEARHELKLPDAGVYQWTVTARNSKTGLQAQAADGWRVLKRGSPPTPFSLVEPPDRSSWPYGSVPHFGWERSANAQSYRVEIQHKTTGKTFTRECSDEKIDVPLEDEGPYEWKVYALVEGDAERLVARDVRTLFITKGVAPEPLMPARDATVYLRKGTIPFRWTEASQASVRAYRLQVFRVGEGDKEEVVLTQDIPVSQTRYDANVPAGDYAWHISGTCDQNMVLESRARPRFHVETAGGFDLLSAGPWVVVALLVCGMGVAGVLLWSRPVEVELICSDYQGGQRSLHALIRRNGPESRIYLSKVDAEDAQYLDVGANDYHIERGLFGLALHGPEGKPLGIRWDEEFGVPRPDGSSINLTLSKAGASEEGADDTPPPDGPDDLYETKDDFNSDEER